MKKSAPPSKRPGQNASAQKPVAPNLKNPNGNHGQPANATRTADPSGETPHPFKSANQKTNRLGIPDWRLEKPQFHVVEARDPKSGEVRFETRGNLNTPVAPIRESKYLKREQYLEIYRYMLLNRRMEIALENLYKQGKVVGGVYFGLGQEACSVASAYALDKDDWFAPMIRNQGALLVRGFRSSDVMMQYMAKAGSPTKGKDGTSHYGDIGARNMVSPISMLGDLIPVMAGVALGARLQGKQIASLTWIGDGGQSTGVTYEGINFAAVKKLGLVLVVESNSWAYSTPSEHQYLPEDLADRALGYGIPAVIIDGTDACQVYDATRAAVERAHRGEGASIIEAKMMRMKGHAIHDAALYVPKEIHEFWRKRDPIDRFERFLLEKKWLTKESNEKMIAEVEAHLEEEREFAVNSPMPEGPLAAEGVYCHAGCHDIKPKYAMPKVKTGSAKKLKETEAAIHFK